MDPHNFPTIDEDFKGSEVVFPDTGQSFVKGAVKTPAGNVPQIGSRLTFADRFGSFKVRWNIGRNRYRIEPGLYALGNPGDVSPVLVTANYKMSFDRLRESVKDLDAWILVLNTDGVNVWCSAGKKTFSTGELVKRVHTSGIEKIVSHRKLILPQLSAPGVSAHEVKRLSGFEVIYGPIRASDLMSFIYSGFNATREMRRKTFTLKERLVLIPVELTAAGKWFFLISLGLFLLGGLRGLSWSWAEALDHGLFAVLAFLGALFAGAVLTPILLPWMPGRAFSLKGMVTGFLVALLLGTLRIQVAGFLSSYLEVFAWIFLASSISAYLAMNFTGASTYTSLSGVKKEMKSAIPLEIVGGAVGLCLWVSSLLVARG